MQENIHYSKDIEAAVLGICMLEKLAFGRTYNLIDEQVFYFDDNKKVYSTLKEMYDNSQAIDILTVVQKMVSEGIELYEKNTAFYLTKLTHCVVSSAHLEYHCHLLKDMWRKREMIRITSSPLDVSQDVRKQGLSINEQINNLFAGTVKQDWYTMDQLMFDLMIHQQEIALGNKTFITTGFKAIDKMNGGFSPGQLIVIGARPSVGKSALMNKIAFSIAESKKNVGIISLEMNNTEIAARLAALDTETSFSVIYRNLFNDEKEREIFYNRISKKTIHNPIYVSDKTKVDVSEIKSKAIKLKHAYGLDILIVDYLQLVDSVSKVNTNREQEVAKISRGLKLMAMELEIPVVVLCQLNRAVTHRKGKDRFPQLSDLRESGAIEQDADVVMMLHRDWMSGYEQHPDTEESTERSADLLGVKWRNGGQFHLELDFHPELMKFSEKSQMHAYHTPKDNSFNDDNPF